MFVEKDTARRSGKTRQRASDREEADATFSRRYINRTTTPEIASALPFEISFGIRNRPVLNLISTNSCRFPHRDVLNHDGSAIAPSVPDLHGTKKMAPIYYTAKSSSVLARDDSSTGNVLDESQLRHSRQSHRRVGCLLTLKAPVSHCLLRGMSNSIGGGIGKSVRAALSAFSNLESEELPSQ